MDLGSHSRISPVSFNNLKRICFASLNISVSVSDTGSGISENDLESLFQPFKVLTRNQENNENVLPFPSSDFILISDFNSFNIFNQ